MDVDGRLYWWERCGIGIVGIGILILWGVALQRATLTRYPMGDAGIFFHAGWAAREGGELLYKVTSASGLHYHYPPIFACLLIPFADPPPGMEDRQVMPYPVAIVVWFGVNLACLLAGLHLVCCAVESSDPQDRPRRWGRRWWSLRFLAFFVCLPAAGSTLVKGQVSPILLLLIGAAFAAGLTGRRLVSGACLAAAVCTKIFPAFLALMPLWRRDGRALVGGALGLVMGLIILPVGAFGVDRTRSLYQELSQVLIAPALGVGEDTTRGKELLHTNGNFGQSLVTAINNLMHPNREIRPLRNDPLAGKLHWLIGGVMTLVTLWAFRKKSLPSPVLARRELLFGGTLVAVMILICPVSHLHYLMLLIPLVVGLVATERQGVYPGARLLVVLGVHVGTVVLAQLPWLIELKDKCLPTYGLVVLWAYSCWVGDRLGQAEKVEVATTTTARQAA